jgi:Co/Zn/Cd efflux system component
MTPFYPHSHIKKNRRTLLHIWEHAIGKIGVILTGLVVRVVPKFAGKDTWFIYVDPAITMVVITIILSSAIPLGHFSLYTSLATES